MSRVFLISVCVLLATVALSARATEPDRDAFGQRCREAVARGLAVVEGAGRRYPEHRQCFSCHHQTLPMQAAVTARRGGAQVDEALLASQAELTIKSFAERAEKLAEGQGIGGRAMTVGYGLWSLWLVDWQPDDTTAAMVSYLLKTQEEDGHWQRATSRPPLEESNLTCTVLAASGVRRFATDEQREEVDAAIQKAIAWFESATAESQEDLVARLMGYQLFGDSNEQQAAARQAIVDAQREDGGWSQLPDMQSDAYATGLTLYVLRGAGLKADDPVYRRGAEFLLNTQLDDGSWLVETRSKPVQVFFDNGDPHGKHQFISTSATCWAVAALARAAD